MERRRLGRREAAQGGSGDQLAKDAGADGAVGNQFFDALDADKGHLNPDADPAFSARCSS